MQHGRLEADLVADKERDAKLDEDHGDEFEVDKEEISTCAPTWRARCRVSEE